jgi:3alpha(or 20beta)-hydroxysteroid dehydrogenase
MSNTIDLSGRFAVVTGGAQGIGRAITERFLDSGASVAIWDRDTAFAQKTADELKTRGKVVAIAVDVTKLADVERARDDTVKAFGRLDILVNNAGIYRMRSLLDTTDEDFDEITRINQRGPFLGMRAAASAMKASGGGSIINISSGAGLRGVRNMLAYATTKWALRGMTKCAALDLAPDRIRVNSIHPGVIETPMLKGNPDALNQAMVRATPMGRIGQPEDIARMVLYLASDAASFITGGEFAVDGGAII